MDPPLSAMPIESTFSTARPRTRAQARAEGIQAVSQATPETNRKQFKTPAQAISQRRLRTEKSSVHTKPGSSTLRRSERISNAQQLKHTSVQPKSQPVQPAPKKSAKQVSKPRIQPSKVAEKKTKAAVSNKRLTSKDRVVVTKKAAKSVKARQDPGPQGSESSQGQTPFVTHWLERVGSGMPTKPRSEKTSPDISEFDFDSYSDMPSRKSSQPILSEDVTTVKEGRDGKITSSKLRHRGIDEEEHEDREWLSSHQALLDTTLPLSKPEAAAVFVTLLQDTLENLDPNETHKYYEPANNLRLKLDKWTADIQHPVILPEYFHSLLLRCLNNNEAILQRTVMMNVFHHHWIGEELEWNAEGVWLSQTSDTRIRSMITDYISRPKPDLAISYKVSYFQKHVSRYWGVPNSLERAMMPDGGKRCFPVLFMEVKRSGGDLVPAEQTNLHSASQALFNIYHWMKKANLTKKFFENVRVFTFVFNAKELRVRVHRAISMDTQDDRLEFTWAEFHSLSEYSRDDVCLLINSILKQYVVDELGPILLDAFKKVVVQLQTSINSSNKSAPQVENSNAGSKTGRGGAAKRRGQGNGKRGGTSKRLRQSDQSSQEHTGSSQAMEQMSFGPVSVNS